MDFVISILAAYSPWVLSHGFQKNGVFSWLTLEKCSLCQSHKYFQILLGVKMVEPLETVSPCHLTQRVRSGWTPLSGHKAGTLSALWGNPSHSACSGGRLTHGGHSTETFLLHRAKWGWRFRKKMTQKALRQRRGKHHQCFLESPFFTDSCQSFLLLLLFTLTSPFLFFVP